MVSFVFYPFLENFTTHIAILDAFESILVHQMTFDVRATADTMTQALWSIWSNWDLVQISFFWMLTSIFCQPAQARTIPTPTDVKYLLQVSSP